MVQSHAEIVTPQIQAQFKSPDEHVMYAERTQKLRAVGTASQNSQEEDRIYVQTTDNIYTFKLSRQSQQYKQTRFYQIKNVGAIILSSDNEHDFMLFFYSSEDLHLRSNSRSELLSLLTLRFFSFVRNKTLKIYSVPTVDLIKYHINNDPQQKIRGNYDLPPEESRLLDQELQGEDEYNKSQQDGTGTTEEDNFINQAPFEMQQSIEEGQVQPYLQGRTKQPLGNNLQGKVKGDMSEVYESYSSLGSQAFAGSRESVMIGYRHNANVKLEDFQRKALLGKGTFGKVFLATLQGDQTGKQWAIKAIRKDVLLDFKQVQNTRLEKDILFSCDHPFLVGMEYLFQTQERLYFVMPFVRGGELYKIFKANKRLPEPVVKFYALQICLAIGYLHTKGIMHRDLKLENILLDETGYLKIIDYGLAKTLPQDNLTRTFCGTPEYLAPEMVTQQGHDFSVDWWALGILIYEMLIGVTPFYNKERRLLLLKIRQSRVVFPSKSKYRIEYSDDFMDIVLKLLDKNRETRLGSSPNDFQDIINHPFFADIDKEALLARTLTPPLKMSGSQNQYGFDSRGFNLKDTQQDLQETVLPQAKIDSLKKHSHAFDDFDRQGADLSQPGRVPQQAKKRVIN